jgi:hypothetical protein
MPHIIVERSFETPLTQEAWAFWVGQLWHFSAVVAAVKSQLKAP